MIFKVFDQPDNTKYYNENGDRLAIVFWGLERAIDSYYKNRGDEIVYCEDEEVFMTKLHELHRKPE